MIAYLCRFHALLFARQGGVNCDATQRIAPHPPRNADRYRLSMSALAIFASIEKMAGNFRIADHAEAEGKAINYPNRER